MFFYPKHISKEAIEALQSVGLEFRHQNMFMVGEMEIPNGEYQGDESHIAVRGVKLARRKLTFNGHQDPPKVWSSLEGDMVYSGRDLDQCSVCGRWMSDKPSPQDEREHNRDCSPQYEWVLATKVEV